MDLRAYAELIVRYWIVIIATIAVGLIAAVVLIVVATPKYTSTAQVVFTANGGDGGQDMAYAGNYAQTRMQTYKRLATSSEVLSPVIEKFGLDETVSELAGRVSVDVSQVSTFAAISVTDESAAQAAKIANGVSAQLIGVVGAIEVATTDTTGKTTVSAMQGAVVSPAEVENDPSDPNKKLYLGAGGLLGLIMSFGAVAILTATGFGSSRTSRGASTPEDG